MLQCLQAVLTSCCTALERATTMLSCSSGMAAPLQRQAMPRASLPANRDGRSHLCGPAAHHSNFSTLILTSIPALLLQHTRQAVRFLCSEVKANLGRNCVVVREEEQGFESHTFKEVRLVDNVQDQHESLAARHALLARWCALRSQHQSRWPQLWPPTQPPWTDHISLCCPAVQLVCPAGNFGLFDNRRISA